jgi:hypothetical protein
MTDEELIAWLRCNAAESPLPQFEECAKRLEELTRGRFAMGQRIVRPDVTIECDTCDGRGVVMVNAQGPQELPCPDCSAP